MGLLQKKLKPVLSPVENLEEMTVTKNMEGNYKSYGNYKVNVKVEYCWIELRLFSLLL